MRKWSSKLRCCSSLPKTRLFVRLARSGPKADLASLPQAPDLWEADDDEMNKGGLPTQVLYKELLVRSVLYLRQQTPKCYRGGLF
jgi:hypothetical protein